MCEDVTRVHGTHVHIVMSVYLREATFTVALLHIVGIYICKVKWNAPGMKKKTQYSVVSTSPFDFVVSTRHAIKRTRRPFRCQLRIPLSSLTFNQRDYVGLHFCPVYFREAISLRLVQNGSITQGYRCGCAAREMEYCHCAKFDLQSAPCRRKLPYGSYNWRGIQ